MHVPDPECPRQDTENKSRKDGNKRGWGISDISTPMYMCIRMNRIVMGRGGVRTEAKECRKDNLDKIVVHHLMTIVPPQ